MCTLNLKPDIYQKHITGCTTWENASERQTDWLRHVLGDGAVNVRDDHFVIPVPQIDGALAAARALVLGRDAKRHIIRSLLQFQAGLVTQGEQWTRQEAQESSSTSTGSYNEATNLWTWF